MAPSPEPAYQLDGQPVPACMFYRIACDPRRSVAVEACAGAGKTWMLVSRILRALLDGCAPQDILAITFTKKAAGEMRQRLQEWLHLFRDLTPEKLAAELQMRGMDAPEARERSDELRMLHARMLDGGRPVQVRTFHSWFAALLRAAPLAVLEELELPPTYELLEDDSAAVRLVWPRFYARVTQDPELLQDFMGSVDRHGRSGTHKALSAALSKRVEFALADEQGVPSSSVQPFERLYPALAGLTEPAQALLEPDARSRWHARSAPLGTEKNKTPQKAAQAVVDAFLLPDTPQAMTRRLALLRQAFFVREHDRLNQNLLRYPQALEAEQELQLLLAAQRQHQAWLHQQAMTRLTRVLLDEYARLKRERGWVDMNDVERAALRLLSDASLAGWIQQRLDARVRHLLIDEFQDTNPLQWQALHSWLSSYAGAGAGDAPSVFLVGDPKQSIYRFRRAEPQVFRAAQTFIVQGLGGHLLTCDHTRRCAPEVVQTLNQVMGAARESGEYPAFRAHSTHSNSPGEVLMLPPIGRPQRSSAEDGEPEGSPWRDSLLQPRHEPEEKLSALEASQAADWIAHHLLHSGEQPGDLMVLARKRERLGWLHDALRQRGIPSDEPEKSDLSEAPAVQDVLALLDALVSPSQDLSLARALRSPILGWDDAALVALARHRASLGPGVSWWQALQSATEAYMKDAAGRLARWREQVLALPPHDALAFIYRDADLLAAYARCMPAALRPVVLAQLQALLAHSLALDGGRFLTPYRLVRTLRAGGIKAAKAALPAAVRLLTIHGAKGLEASTVLLLDTDARAARPESMGVLVDWPGDSRYPRRFVFMVSEKQPPACAADVLAEEQQARALEELNALYVALTRAGSRLVISSAEPHGDPGVTWFRRLQDLAQPVSGLQASAPVARADAEPSASPSSHGAETTGIAQTPERVDLPELPEWTPPPPAAQVPPPADSARMGMAMHRLLQWRPTPAQSFDWGPPHLRAVAREFSLTPDLARQALDMARRIATGEAAWAWDSSSLSEWHNEIELLDTQGQLMRLDRLVRRKDSGEWWVLDYKSATRPQDQPELRQQLQRYAAAVRLAYPGGVVRCALLSANGECVEIER